MCCKACRFKLNHASFDSPLNALRDGTTSRPVTIRWENHFLAPRLYSRVGTDKILRVRIVLVIVTRRVVTVVLSIHLPKRPGDIVNVSELSIQEVFIVLSGHQSVTFIYIVVPAFVLLFWHNRSIEKYIKKENQR